MAILHAHDYCILNYYCSIWLTLIVLVSCIIGYQAMPSSFPLELSSVVTHQMATHYTPLKQDNRGISMPAMRLQSWLGGAKLHGFGLYLLVVSFNIIEPCSIT